MLWPSVQESNLNAPAPTGFLPKASGSVKKTSGWGAKAVYPKRTGRLETGAVVLMVKVWSSTTARPFISLTVDVSSLTSS